MVELFSLFSVLQTCSDDWFGCCRCCPALHFGWACCMVTSCVHEKDMEIIAEVVYFQLYLAQEHNGQDHIQGQ